MHYSDVETIRYMQKCGPRGRILDIIADCRQFAVPTTPLPNTDEIGLIETRERHIQSVLTTTK